MAKCDLSIELVDPERLRCGGETVRGHVNVHADEDVRCSGLEVRTRWATHGRGNVASADSEMKILFQGEWQAGRTYRYPFELTAARWPPTYHGHYLNVDHYVEARARIPWAFDPKTEQAFPVVAVDSPAAFAEKAVTELQGCAGGAMAVVIGVIFLTVAAMLLFNPFFWVLGSVIGLAAGLWWLVVRWLPRHRLGEVQYSLDQRRLIPGEALQGSLVVQPARDVNINAITWTIAAVEVCVSGSGSNRTTHKHTIFEESCRLPQTGILRGGRQTKFPLHIDLPTRPIYSLDLNDNDLRWTAQLHIDIPRWPDWKQTESFQVVPPTVESESKATPTRGQVPQAMAASMFDTSPAAALAPSTPAITAAADEQAISFKETMQHFWRARENEDQIEQLVAAVREIPMPIQTVIERRLLYGNDDPAAYRDGYVVWAHYADPPTPLTLYIPHALADEFEHLDGDRWEGRGTITGYDRRHRRLQIRIETPH